jgi:hypothetical protein
MCVCVYVCMCVYYCTDAVRVILREEGLVGFYRGLTPALLLTSHGAVQFAVYEQLKASFKTLQVQAEKHNQVHYTTLHYPTLPYTTAHDIYTKPH